MPYKNPADAARKAKECYERAKGAYVARARAHSAKMRAEGRRIVQEHLEANPCKVCGESDPVVLEFDHRDPATKVGAVSDLVRRGSSSLARIRAEIANCDVLCANCHRRKTASQFGWFKTRTDAA